MSSNVVREQEYSKNSTVSRENGKEVLKKILGRRFAPGHKRTVLGTLTSNVRVQPKRAAKQNEASGKENVGKEGPSKSKNSSGYPFSSSSSSVSSFTFSSSSSISVPSFTIYQDPTPEKKKGAKTILVKPAYEEKPDESTDQTPVPEDTKENKVETKEESKENIPLKKWTSVQRLDSSDGAECVPNDLPVLPEDILKVEENKLYDVPEYCEDIYHHNRISELLHKPKPNYMQKQTDITCNMRWILIDWLVEVAEEYNLSCQCLHLAVSYVDRFLSHMSVKRDKLQLVGTTAMFIAAKFEEIYPPEVTQFAYITDNTYRTGQILRMEHLILKVLNFDMSSPTPHIFVNEYGRFARLSEENVQLAQFIAELSMLDSDPFLKYPPSIIAAAAVALANYTLGNTAWPDHLSKKTQYSFDALKECYVHLHKALYNVHTVKPNSIKEKFRNSKFHSVSNLSPREGFPW